MKPGKKTDLVVVQSFQQLVSVRDVPNSGCRVLLAGICISSVYQPVLRVPIPLFRKRLQFTDCGWRQHSDLFVYIYEGLTNTSIRAHWTNKPSLPPAKDMALVRPASKYDYRYLGQ